MISVFAGASGTQVTIAAVIVLIGLCTCLTWLPATRRDPIGLPTRIFITVGLAAAVLDPRGVGAVLGLSLAAMGLIVWWEGQPAPEVPRPRRRGYYIAAILAGLVTYGTTQGWGPLDAIPDSARWFAALFVGLVALLATLAIADRARITFRDKLRRRFDIPPLPPRVLVRPLDRSGESSVTLERIADAEPPTTGSDAEPESAVVGEARTRAELLPSRPDPAERNGSPPPPPPPSSDETVSRPRSGADDGDAPDDDEADDDEPDDAEAKRPVSGNRLRS